MRKEIAHKRLRKKKKVLGLLSLIEGECDGSATYYVTNKMCDKLNLPVPPLKNVVSEIKLARFKASLTHFNRMGFGTDAPASIVTEIIKKF